MVAHLTTAQFQLDKIDEVIKIFEENIMPAAKSQKGYRGGYLLTDRDTGKAIAIGLWDSEEDIAANLQSGFYQEQVGKVVPFLITAPAREVYDVAVQD